MKSTNMSKITKGKNTFKLYKNASEEAAEALLMLGAQQESQKGGS